MLDERGGRRRHGWLTHLGTSWKLWSLPWPAACYVLALQALAATVVVLRSSAPGRHDVLLAAGILGAGVVVGELTMRIERLRRQLADSPYVNMTSVWMLPAALLLPPLVFAAVAAGLHYHLWLRSWRRPAHKAAFNHAVTVLSGCAAGAVMHSRWPDGVASISTPVDAAWLLATISTFAAVNTIAVAIVIGLSTGRWNVSATVGDLPENALEVANLGLGAIVTLLVPAQPLALIALVPTLLVLHRAVLVRQLEHAVTTDGKTGVLNAATWHQLASRELERTRHGKGGAGVLMIDIDHFKRVNDTHGHLMGDAALKAVADALSAEMRDQDLLCRFGGEEFVALLPGATAEDVIPIAERLRQRVAALVVPAGAATLGKLTISIGAAVFPDTAPDLEGLLLAADNALFAAKNGGRDQVRLTDTAPLGD